MLLVAACWRTNRTLRQVAPLSGVSKSAADRILDHLAPLLAISPTCRSRKDTVHVVYGILAPTRDRSVAASGKNHRYSTNLQAVDANCRLVVADWPALARQPQRLPGVHRIRGRPGLPRHPGHHRRRLPGHRLDHPAPQTTRTDAPQPATRSGERRAPRGARTRGTRPVSAEEPEGPAGLPAQGQRRSRAMRGIARLHDLALTG